MEYGGVPPRQRPRRTTRSRRRGLPSDAAAVAPRRPPVPTPPVPGVFLAGLRSCLAGIRPDLSGRWDTPQATGAVNCLKESSAAAGPALRWHGSRISSPGTVGLLSTCPGLRNSLAHWTSRESFGENEIQLEVAFPSALSTLKDLHERTSDPALEPSQSAGPP